MDVDSSHNDERGEEPMERKRTTTEIERRRNEKKEEERKKRDAEERSDDKNALTKKARRNIVNIILEARFIFNLPILRDFTGMHDGNLNKSWCCAFFLLFLLLLRTSNVGDFSFFFRCVSAEAFVYFVFGV